MQQQQVAAYNSSDNSNKTKASIQVYREQDLTLAPTVRLIKTIGMKKRKITKMVYATASNGPMGSLSNISALLSSPSVMTNVVSRLLGTSLNEDYGGK